MKLELLHGHLRLRPWVLVLAFSAELLVAASPSSGAGAADGDERSGAADRCLESLTSVLEIVRKADAPVDVAGADLACADARRAALDPARDVSARFELLIDPLARFSNVAASLDDLEVAGRAIDAAVQLADRLTPQSPTRADHLVSQARIRGRRGDPAAEESGMLEALALAEKDPDPLHAAGICALIADMFERRREYDSAESYQLRRIDRVERRIELSRGAPDPADLRTGLTGMQVLDNLRASAEEDLKRVRSCRKAARRGKRAPLECCIRTGDCAER
jgi:hypothetical protein